MAKLWKHRVFGIKQETTQGTLVSSASLVSTDYFPVYDFNLTPVVEQLDNTVVGQFLGSPQTIPGLKNIDVDCKFWLYNTGSAGNLVLPMDALLGSCGVTGSTGASGTYKPTSGITNNNMIGPAESITIWGNYDNIAAYTWGVVGNMKMTFEQGKKVDCEYNGKGLYSGSYDLTIPSGAYGNFVPPICQNIQFQIGNYTFICDKFSIDFGNQIQAISDVNSPNGIYGYTITDRKPVGSLTVLATNVATYDFWNKLDSAVVASGSCIIGTSAGNKFTFNFGSIQYSDVKYTNANGLINVDATLKFNESDITNTWLSMIVQ